MTEKLNYAVSETLRPDEIIEIAAAPLPIEDPRGESRYRAAQRHVFNAGPLGGLNPKMVREALCRLQVKDGERYAVLQDLCNLCDAMRPIGSNGKHGNNCTEYFGCRKAEAER